MINGAPGASWVPRGFKDGIYSVLFCLVVLYWAVNCLLSALLPLLAFSVSGRSIEEEIGWDG
ncbi:MAG: hypothetical protein V4671_32730 [Armatimonadota bacterium]